MSLLVIAEEIAKITPTINVTRPFKPIP